MKQFALSISAALTLFLGSTLWAQAADTLPVMDGKEIVATVNEEPITLEEFNQALYELHGRGDVGDVKKTAKVDYEAPLTRLINTKLILLEAKNIGLDELPIYQQRIGEFSRQGLGALLLEKQTKDLKADQKLVDQLYKEAVKEYHVKSMKLESEEIAKKLAKDIDSGQNFDTVITKAIADGTAKGTAEAEFFKQKDMLPQINQALAKMKTGEVSPVIPIPGGFVIMKLIGVRYPDDPQARQQAEASVLKRQKEEAKRNYIESLQKKYAKIDKELLKSVDYEAKEPGLEKMLQDKRPLATIEGEEPITVGDIAAQLQKKFFHGVEQAMGKGKVNQQKEDLLYKIITTRVLLKEAMLQGIDKTDVFKNTVEDYKTSLLFGAFVEKVILPDIHVDEKDIKQYYQEHIASYSSPPMIRIQSLVFADKDQATQVLQKLKTGTDFKWLTAHAEGLLDQKTEGLLKFDGKLLLMTTLPEDLQKALAGSKAGDFQIYTDAKGHSYVLSIEEIIAPVPQELADVSDDIKEKVFKVKLQQSLDDWVAKLKQYYPVKIYIENLADLAK
ncbi:MAG: peptidyl-prolyl cis-trans isomerase [Desulfobulbaceae bacterium]|nr:peptidyl-prolyl cis-trans isomerase [Desulfobulbaceae bacterium]